MSDVSDPAHYHADEILRDGGSIHVRAIRADDRERLLRHFKELSEQSRYLRFFGVKHSLSDTELEQFTRLDFVNHVGLVATLRRDNEERFIGVARYVRGADPGRAEIAFAVVDEHQGRGIATVLLEHLSRIARSAAITEFEADVLGSNNRMLEVFAKSGFQVKRAGAAGVIHLAFPTAETQEFISASQAREREAATHSIEWILRPKSIAVLGASREPTKIGAAVLANLRKGGFTGPLYPVNPNARQVQGVPSFASLEAVGQPIDLVVIAVPASAVEQAVADCARAGVHAVVVISAGFAEAGSAGRDMEVRIRDLVRQSGMRLVGPNCMGIVNTDSRVRLNATFAPVSPPAGNIGIFSQSGALGIAIFEHLRQRHLGLSSFVAAGNRADVSNNDVIAYWAGDANTAVIALYLESVGNPRKFAPLARETAMIKPIVAVKSGRSAAGRRVASSHSAALANRDIAVDALFDQAGVIRTDTLEALFDLVAMLSSQPLPRGPRVGVVGNAGGPAVLFADACEAQGLQLAEMELDTVERLRSSLKTDSALSNPVDLGPAAEADDIERALLLVGNDPNIDSVVAMYVPPRAVGWSEAAAAIARGAAQIPEHKPVATVFLSTRGIPAELSSGPRGIIPAYSFPENSAIALGAAWRYSRWRTRPRGSVETLGRFARDTIRAVADRALAEGGGVCWLSREEITTVLRAMGIAVVQPEDSLKQLQRPNDPADTVVAAGLRMVAGVTIDPTFGPLVACGFGGLSPAQHLSPLREHGATRDGESAPLVGQRFDWIAELLGDVVFRLHPVTDVDAGEMLGCLKSSPLLDGYRGAPPGDRQALIALLMRVSALVELVPEMTELDLDPVSVQPPGQGAFVLDARMHLQA